MAVNDPSNEEVQAVFNQPLGTQSLDEVAASSNAMFVRSQIQIARDNPRATGMRMVAREALQRFGWSVLRELAIRDAVPIVNQPGELARSLAHRRTLLGAEGQNVARAANLSFEDLCAFEAGLKQIPIRQIERLGQVLAFELDGKHEEIESQNRVAVRLREFADSLDKIALSPALVLRLSEAAWIIGKQAKLQAHFQSEVGAHLSQMGFVPSQKYDRPAYRWGYKLAHKTRQLLGLTQTEPILSLRVLVEERLQIPVIQADLPNQFAGATVSNGTLRGIVLNLQGYNENPWVRRNTLAHEIGHLLWDPEGRLNTLRVDTFSDLEPVRDESKDPVEARANAFATELLAPQKAVLQLCDGPISDEDAIVRVCEKFGISPSAARYQIQNIRQAVLKLCDGVTSDEDAIVRVCEKFGIASSAARYQIQNARENGIELSMPHFPIHPSDEWKSAENFVVDHFPPAPDVPIHRRGRFAYWVVRTAKERLISLDTAGSFLGLEIPLTEGQVDAILALLKN